MQHYIMSTFDELLAQAFENASAPVVNQQEPVVVVQPEPVMKVQQESNYVPEVKAVTVENSTASATSTTWNQITSTPEFIGTVAGMSACAVGLLALWLNE